MIPRKIHTVVLSDIHLGTVGCHALELLQYLNSINPSTIILNGDFIDVWNFRKYYWPDSHMMVLRTLLSKMANGTDIYYITGNHDDVLRKVSSLQLGPLIIRDKLIMELNGEKIWIFHGDIFDVTMKHSKWIARIGGKGYDLLIMLNKLINWLSVKMGRGKISLSKRIKSSVKKAVQFIDNFEHTAMELAIEQGYDYENGSVIYMNSGDWVENLTALEFDGDQWSMYRYSDDQFGKNSRIEKIIKSKSKLSETVIG